MKTKTVKKSTPKVVRKMVARVPKVAPKVAKKKTSGSKKFSDAAFERAKAKHFNL